MESRPESPLAAIYNELLNHFGPQGWWPANSPLEIAVGAVLVQNTSWSNVEKAIICLKRAGLLNWRGLANISAPELAPYIKSSGYYNLKAKRLVNLLTFLKTYRPWHSFFEQSMPHARAQLLQVKGIGPETADALLLYVGKKASFVADIYTLRVLSRHRMLPANAGYDEVRGYFMERLPHSAEMFGEFHALLLALAKAYCYKTSPNCQVCPLKPWLDGYYEEPPA